MYSNQCPKCRGDVYLDEFWEGVPEYVCFKCWYVLSPKEALALYHAPNQGSTVYLFSASQAAKVKLPSTNVFAPPGRNVLLV